MEAADVTGKQLDAVSEIVVRGGRECSYSKVQPAIFNLTMGDDSSYVQMKALVQKNNNATAVQTCSSYTTKLFSVYYCVTCKTEIVWILSRTSIFLIALDQICLTKTKLTIILSFPCVK